MYNFVINKNNCILKNGKAPDGQGPVVANYKPIIREKRNKEA
jgi:hypothetical protein